MNAASIAGIFRPGMRAYFIPLVAGIVLALSAFLPWIIVSDVPVQGVADLPGVPGFWVAGLGASATVLSLLSLVTRKNSRHPLLLVGLVALGIMFLSWRILPRTAGEHALTVSQAFAIVENTPMTTAPAAAPASGIFVGMAAACAIVGFGLTIVMRRAGVSYSIASPDDDVDDVDGVDGV
jgi:hypothetical protein